MKKENNGWIKIENENDLPKERCDLFVLLNGKIMYYMDYNPDEIQCINYVKQTFKYYQIIKKPELPII